jgi:hypothetical protein
MESRQLGDYLLKEIISEEPGQIHWLAEQASVQRTVLLIELTDLSKRDEFLADVRAKASVVHPLIGSVFEAVSDDDQCFVALEHISSQSLAARLSVREPLKPAALAHVLRRVAEAMIQLAANGTATEPLTPAAIHLDSHGVVRIDNLAQHGEPDPEAAGADIARLGNSLAALVADGHPGASRVLIVLAWMRGESIEKPLTWEQVRGYGEQIEGQLLETSATVTSPQTKYSPKPKKPVLPAVLGFLAAIVVLGILLMIFWPKPPPDPPVSLPVLPEPIMIPGGSHPTPDGNTEKIAAFRIAPCEVTIGQYLNFLEVLEQLDPDERGVFDLEGQPEEKTDHFPSEWDEMLAAAKAEGTWNGKPISTFHPIVNIDWWDASAYCNWRGCRLPTQEEWFAALRHGAERPEVLEPAPWTSVISIKPSDRTTIGLRGMAGSVAEWTRRPAINPANPLGAKRFVIIGGSFVDPGAGALQREWTNDRLQRRPDLGFRVVFPAE